MFEKINTARGGFFLTVGKLFDCDLRRGSAQKYVRRTAATAAKSLPAYRLLRVFSKSPANSCAINQQELLMLIQIN
jgi:hypothetical protein